MKKIVLTLATIATLMTTFTAPKSEAAIGYFIGQPIVMAVGGAAELYTAGWVVAVLTSTSHGVLMGFAMMAPPAFLFGLVALEDSNANTVKYAALNLAQSTQLGLTKKQMSAFNANVEIFNAIEDQIAMNVTAKSTMKEVTSQWKTALNDLQVEQDAIVGLSKVSAQLFKK